MRRDIHVDLSSRDRNVSPAEIVFSETSRFAEKTRPAEDALSLSLSVSFRRKFRPFPFRTRARNQVHGSAREGKATEVGAAFVAARSSEFPREIRETVFPLEMCSRVSTLVVTAP